jgi:acylphosphatase
VRVYGLVQGVYYRAETQQRAGAAGVAGWVRNLPDGSVEAVFEGADSAVEALIVWCRHGPRGARVETVEVSPEEPRGEDGFRVTG